MFRVVLLVLMTLSYSWIMSRLFIIAYSAIMNLFLKLSARLLKIASESYQYTLMIGYAFFSKLLGYYIACIWSAFVVYWIVIPNYPDTSWWLYGLALAGFLMAKCVDVVTFSMFAVFCFKPELIDSLYGWVPFRIMYLDYPWLITAL